MLKGLVVYIKGISSIYDKGDYQYILKGLVVYIKVDQQYILKGLVEYDKGISSIY